MKYCTVAITLLFSVSRSRPLVAGDDNAIPDGYAEELLRQLKVMPTPPAKCSCEDGYTMRNGTCIRTVEVAPQEICPTGRMVDGLCVTPAPPVLQCPEEYITVCTSTDTVQSPCCAKAHTAEKIARCREGAQIQDGHCKRVLAHEPVIECPPGFALTGSRSECYREELGDVSPLCMPPDVLSPEGDSCITSVQNGFEYICPAGYECIAHEFKKKKYTPLCSACAKTMEATPYCGCPEGLKEVDGLCFEESTYAKCQFRRPVPRKQAPSKKSPPFPTKEKEIEEEIDCNPIASVSCACEAPYILQCQDDICTCIQRIVTPLVPVCRGQIDELGNCIEHVQKRLLYQCAEGFTCDIVNKKGRCQCVRVVTAEPAARCALGEPHDGRCIQAVYEEKIIQCPPGYIETCCENGCSCTKTDLVTREVTCSMGAVNIQGQCAYVSKPYGGCEEGLLRGEKCVQDLMAPPICG